MNVTSSLLIKYWLNQRVNYSIRIIFSLSCVVFYGWWSNNLTAVNPLVLGIIASALAENDDDLLGRAKALLITLTCFALTTLSSELLFNYHLIFAIGLSLSTFAFTMLGALGSRYKNIAFASLLIAIYSMLSTNQTNGLQHSSWLLLCGALSYGLVSLLWLVIWPTQQVQQSLSQLYAALARYLELTSDQYYPSQLAANASNDITYAKQNAIVVEALNRTRISLVSRIHKGKIAEKNQHFLHLYFIAQDIHERASALQSPPQHLKQRFFHADLMFRLQHMLQRQAQSCNAMSQRIILGQSYQHSHDNVIALDELNSAIIKAKQRQDRASFISKLESIWDNLVNIEKQFEQTNQHRAWLAEEAQVSDPDAQQWSDMLASIKSQLHIKSLLFRHAIRLSSAFLLGYAIIQACDLTHGYWVLLTILLVCQMNYSATLDRLLLRILGTLLGLVVGAPLLFAFPDVISQLVLLIAFGGLYFAFRTSHYMTSTIFITLLVLMSFSQSGTGFDAILPRMLNTLIGCFITVGAVRFILPDWQAHRMRGIMADAIDANQHYLAQIIIQFKLGKKDSLGYRQARRDAHNKAAELTQAISNMLNEPGRYQNAVDETFRFLSLNHNLLSHISTLGALRQQLSRETLDNVIMHRHHDIFVGFNQIKRCLLDEKHPVVEYGYDQDNRAAGLENGDDIGAQIWHQLTAIGQCIPELTDLARFLAQKPLQHSKA